MKHLLLLILFVAFFNNKTDAQSDLSGYIEIEPNPAIEGQMVTIGFISGCRTWTDHSFNINGFVIDYEVTYHPCLIGVPPPEGFVYYNIEALPAGDYQINLTINDGFTPPTQYQESIIFGVLPLLQVPVNTHGIFIILVIMFIAVAGLYLRNIDVRK